MSAPTAPDAAAWEASLYDWHNDHRLRRQQADIAYWLTVTEEDERLLVLGAGTGRVAVPLAEHRHRSVTAVDASLARLRRMPRAPGLTPVCADMRELPLHGPFDAAVVPYSTLQLLLTAPDRHRALTEAARVLRPGAYIHIDVSGNFDARAATDWHLALAEPCPAAGATVEEWERQTPMSDHVLIEKSFRIGEQVLTEVQERWAYLGSLRTEAALDRAGFDLTGTDHGYGAEASPHRLIHHGRRRH
ncbi:class I SAM-dependent methyltransferase [Streptomyces sp. NPDC059788]|uniref:class I SAM-dependent methyltransferase n=1 Tax=Streptomyces sp. NPDC059788 TaxID=3346948 RepID=UPI003653762A